MLTLSLTCAASSRVGVRINARIARRPPRPALAGFSYVHLTTLGAEVVYAKSWGALPFYGRPEDEWALRKKYRYFIVDEEKMALTDNGLFSHCLPLRRNIKATDGVMDADYCVAIDEAENRLHVQKAIMMRLLGVAPRQF